MTDLHHGASASDTAGHDHQRCIKEAMRSAEQVCAARGVRLTDLRRQVLELVWHSHVPIGAYEIMKRLAPLRGRVGPPTVYRALDFLTGEGLVHRIDSLNAYLGCAAPTGPHRAFFLLCAGCGNAAEFQDGQLAGILARSAATLGFQMAGATVEVTGLCADCQGRPHGPASGSA